MAYDIDVLISFTEEDNHATDSGRGWVEDFKIFLELMMVQVLGDKPNVILKSEHDSVAGANLTKVAVLIPVISSSFIASGECLDTLEDFFTSINKTGPRRVFKVLKRPVVIEDQPSKLRDLLSYELFNMNIVTEEVRDYTNFFTSEAERDFWMRLVDLAYDVYESLVDLKYQAKKTDQSSDYARKSVYLAETGHDLSIQRNIIKRELQRYGYKVLPDHTLPAKADVLRKIVGREIENCHVSIHLIGTSYGEIPEGSDKSVVDIQNEIAAEKGTRFKDKSEFSRLIWISPRLDNASEKQIAFVENIKRDMASSEAAEILQTPLEDFKNVVREELIEVRLDKRFLHADISDDANNSVYVLYDKVDSEIADEVKKVFKKEGYNILEPVFECELLALRQTHIENLRKSDVAVVIQGKVNYQWVNMKALDLLKAPGFGRQKPLLGKAIVSTRDPQTLEIYQEQDFKIIPTSEDVMIKEMAAFIEDLKEVTL